MQHDSRWVSQGRLPLLGMRAYSGEDVMDAFFSMLMADVETLKKHLELDYVPYKHLPEDDEKIASATHCHICRRLLSVSADPWDLAFKDTIVTDHDHVTGLYRGRCHSRCNAAFTDKKSQKIPVYFHNLKGYDGNHILQGIANLRGDLKHPVVELGCIAKSMERFTCLDVNRKVRFLDTMAFLHHPITLWNSSWWDLNRRILKKNGRKSSLLFMNTFRIWVRKRVC